MEQRTQDIHDKIQAALAVHPPEAWSLAECRIVLAVLNRISRARTKVVSRGGATITPLRIAR